ncbi:MAG: fasciclin domain-containing protein [Cytophagales bacterium]|nr:fasciclin domain-containing protein [Cytophagales bacterium]
MNRTIKVIALVGLLLGPASVASAQNADNAASSAGQGTARNAKTLAQLVASDARFSKLKAALEAADMTAVLETPGPFTVFAPTDEAFDKLQEVSLEDLFKVENKDRLLSILRYHIVPGRVTAAQLQKTNILKTVETQELSVRRVKDQVTINGARISQPALTTSNGVVYVIDKVLVPSEQQNVGNTGGEKKDDQK